MTSWTKEPDAGRVSGLVDHFIRSSETNSRLVHVEVSALGIHLRFIGVSRVIGRSALDRYCQVNQELVVFFKKGYFTREVAFSGRPDLGSARLLVS